MKIVGKMKITVLAKNSKVNESNGKISYSLTIMQDSEAGAISCSKEVFDLVKTLHSYDFLGTYDDKYGYMKLSNVDVKSECAMGN